MSPGMKLSAARRAEVSPGMKLSAARRAKVIGPDSFMLLGGGVKGCCPSLPAAFLSLVLWTKACSFLAAKLG
jgi:hypothetical protein